MRKAPQNVAGHFGQVLVAPLANRVLFDRVVEVQVSIDVVGNVSCHGENRTMRCVPCHQITKQRLEPKWLRNGPWGFIMLFYISLGRGVW